MDWPALSILVITFNRIDTLRGTLQRIDQHLDYTGQRQVFVADDGSDDGTQAMLHEEFPQVQLVQSHRVGLGANTNAGLRAAFASSQLVFQTQDDMWLLGHLDLHPHITQLLTDETCGFIRLWGVGGHRYEGRLEGNYWRVMWHSPELYIPSDRPHVKHFRFHRHFGFYPEGLLTDQTEDAWCHQCKARAGANEKQMDVFVPQGMDTERNFEHMHWGERWRDKGL